MIVRLVHYMTGQKRALARLRRYSYICKKAALYLDADSDCAPD